MTDNKMDKSGFSAEIGDAELEAVLGDLKSSVHAWSDAAYGRQRGLETVLGDFKATVHAWSDAAYSRPRTVAMVKPQWNWRLAAGYALGCVVLAGGLTDGLHQREVHREQARMVAAQQAKRMQLAAEKKSAAEESDSDLLAAVDSDVSREVPSAMEPLAQLMDDDSTQ